VTVEKHRTDAGMILALLMAVPEVDGSTVRESMQHAMAATTWLTDIARPFSLALASAPSPAAR
jgi:hypothetical protein